MFHMKTKGTQCGALKITENYSTHYRLIIKKMSERLERLKLKNLGKNEQCINYKTNYINYKTNYIKLKRCGQRDTVTKNRQETNSLLEADTPEPASIRRLTTILGVLEDKLIVLKALDDEISEGRLEI